MAFELKPFKSNVSGVAARASCSQNGASAVTPPPLLNFFSQPAGLGVILSRRKITNLRARKLGLQAEVTCSSVRPRKQSTHHEGVGPGILAVQVPAQSHGRPCDRGLSRLLEPRRACPLVIPGEHYRSLCTVTRPNGRTW
eukprot:jgi/Botrbrau1/13702/Bobra.250_2s0003.1